MNIASTCAACALICLTSANAELFIDIMANPIVEGPEILLKDLAANPSRLPDGWEKRTVAKAPAPGKSSEYNLSSIAYALQKYPDMQDVILRGCINLKVDRHGSSLAQDIISEAIKNYVKNNDKWRETEHKVTCEQISDSIVIATDKPTAVTVKSMEPYGRTNRYKFVLSVQGEGLEENTVAVNARITESIKTWVSSKDLMRGHVINMDDCEVRSITTDNDATEYFGQAELVDGLELSKPVKAGEALTRSCLMPPVCAERGDTINIKAVRGTLEVSLMAKAMVTGRKGDKILCMNEQSKRRLSVRLVGPKEGMVD